MPSTNSHSHPNGPLGRKFPDSNSLQKHAGCRAFVPRVPNMSQEKIFSQLAGHRCDLAAIRLDLCQFDAARKSHAHTKYERGFRLTIYAAMDLCGSSTNFLAAPLSKSL